MTVKEGRGCGGGLGGGAEEDNWVLSETERGSPPAKRSDLHQSKCAAAASLNSLSFMW